MSDCRSVGMLVYCCLLSRCDVFHGTLLQSLPKLSAEDTNSLRLVNVLMFDELMTAVLKIIGKLDLSSQSVDEGEEVRERREWSGGEGRERDRGGDKRARGEGVERR